MSNELLNKVLKRLLNNDSAIQLKISGNSMNPILKNNEIVNVYKKNEYEPGDILIFCYKKGVFLIHRLLLVEKNRYYCKGDNSFRLEDINYEQIIGFVPIEHDKNNNEEFVEFSLKIGKLFRKLRFNADLLMRTDEYKEYKSKYLSSYGE